MVKYFHKIERILSQCQDIDDQEEDNGSLIKLKKELTDQKTLKAKIAEVGKELQESGKQKLNTTDTDSFVSKSDRGAKMYHNIQATVDEKHGLIVCADVVEQSVDNNQLSVQTQQAGETLNKKPDIICADNGYYSIDDIEKIAPDSTAIVPSRQQIVKERTGKPLKYFQNSKMIHQVV